ncbi:MAG: cytochrome b N-terminal domain-containing protein [Vampirovibrionales bacterium]|nr:cytochrome b N-terminal domain-containing protein [Vampirovibrionales bacterium]
MAVPPASSSKANCDCALKGWFIDRLGLGPVLTMVAKKTVPVHTHSVWYYLGGIALMLIGIQFVTGLLLMVHYVPSIDAAYASILNINTRVDFGWFVRSFHSWSANLLILALFIHMFSTYFMKAYRAPREMTWLTGLVLLVVCMGFGFTGYLLPWDEVAYAASKIGLDITSKVPVIGAMMATLLRGGEVVGQATLSRFFLIHVIGLPLALIGLLGTHLWLVQAHGISRPEADNALPEAQKKSEPFVPNFALKDAMVWLLVINLVATLVALFPWGLGAQADPAAPAPMGIKPEWYFLAMFQFLKGIPAYVGPLEGEQAGLLFFSAIGLVFASAPFVDKTPGTGVSKLYHWFGCVVLAGMILFTFLGFQ